MSSTTINNYSEKFLSTLSENPITEAKKLSIPELEKLLLTASELYYSTDKQLIPDDVFDELIDYLTEVSPKSAVLQQIGDEPMDEATKVKLLYHLGSMDKIKPGSRKLDLWFDKFSTGPYVISDKLDGLSGLLVVELDQNNNLKTALYTRGNGTYGQDVSHLLELIKWGTQTNIKKAVSISKNKRIVVRGEIIINETVYEKKYANKYPKSRSLVAGIVNSKVDSRTFAANKGIASDIEFIAYQLLEPELIPADKQFELLDSYGFLVVNNSIYTTSPKTELDELFIKRRNESSYKIDGIIITDCSKSYNNPTSGNPKHSIAFKMPLTDQQSETVIEEIEWNISKNGILKPRIRYNPIIIDGDTLLYTTGFNAKYIKDNNLGPGAKIVIIRSGDVIPYIKKIISPAVSGKWSEPTVAYTWSETGVEALANDLTGVDYISKTLVHFFKVLGVDGMKQGTINKLVNAGFDTIETILNLKPENLLDVAGFNIRSSEKLVDNLRVQVLEKEHKLEVIMTASNIFKGFGVRKLVLITDYMKVTGYTFAELTTDKITSIAGFSTKTAKQIIDMIPDFVQWLQGLPQLKTIDIYSTKSSKGLSKVPRGKHITKSTLETKGKTTKILKEPTHNKQLVDDSDDDIDEKKESTLLGKNIVVTGFRDADLVSKFEELGGNNQMGVNGKTHILIIKDTNAAKGTKYNKAIELGVEVITKENFIKKYLAQ